MSARWGSRIPSAPTPTSSPSVSSGSRSSGPSTRRTAPASRTEIAFGKTAGLLPDGNTPVDGRAGGNNLYIASAYAQYLTDWGITMKAGKFGTLLGAEVAQAPMNFNISRGLVYNLLQPIDHVGIMASGELPAEGWDWALAVVNDVFKTQPTLNNGKAMMGHVGYSTETWSANLNGIWGTDTPGEQRRPVRDHRRGVDLGSQRADLDVAELRLQPRRQRPRQGQ